MTTPTRNAQSLTGDTSAGGTEPGGREVVKYLPLDAPYCPNPANAPWVDGSSDPIPGSTMRVRIWGGTTAGVQELRSDGGTACVDLIAPDGRTVQVVFYDNGAVLLRGWAAGDIHEQGGDNTTAFSWSPNLLPQGEAEPCSCGGKRWVDDENWQGDYLGPGVQAVRNFYNGWIPCGSCNPEGEVPDA